MKKVLLTTVLFSMALWLALSSDVKYLEAQGTPPPPLKLSASNGSAPGTVILSWDEVPDESSYRIGWLAVEDYEKYKETTWAEKFAYSDVTAASTYTVSRLTPGIEYHLIVGRIVSRADNGYATEIKWSDWETLQLNTEPSSCPKVPQTQSPTPATAGDYDADNDGLIEVSGLAQLNAIRWDLDGDGESRDSGYAQAFPGALEGMGCPDEDCTGYELTADLDFDTNGNGQADAGDNYWHGGAGWNPIGGFGFAATFDGKGHTISNLYIDRTESPIGLFGSARSDSVIRNIGLVSAQVTGNNEVGVLVGDHQGKIENAYATGSVNGNGQVGGLVGSISRSTIQDSHTNVTVTATGDEVGGLVGGSFSSGLIANSYANGNVDGDGEVGGLIGSNWSVTVRNSYATGDVTGTSTSVGGLVGDTFSSVTLTETHATGVVTGTREVGGLVGDGSSATVRNSYSVGNVTGTTEVGGLVGSSGGTLTGNYSTGNVTATGEVGGLVGSISGASITACYATGNVTSTGDEVGGLVGGSFSSGTITSSYSTGTVTGNREVGGLLGSSWGVAIKNSYAVGSITGTDEVGGLVGDKFGSSNVVTASYWDTQTTGQASIQSNLY